MLEILTAAEMRAADLETIEAGTPARVLMERVARAALDLLERKFDTRRVLFVCGNGGNGGDGFAMARFFAEHGGEGEVLYVGPLKKDGTPDTENMNPDTKAQLSLLPARIPLRTELSDTDFSAVVDALFGIGLSRPLNDRCKETVEGLNALGLPTLSIDLPSGVETDTGAILGAAIKATATLCVEAKKPAHLLFPASALCGEITVAHVQIKAKGGAVSELEKSDLSNLPPRPQQAHKGSFGRVLVIGGSVGMSGAAHLSAKAAYRMGAGLVEIFCPEQNRQIHQIALPEALVTSYDPDHFDEGLLLSALERADAVALGMGLSQAPLSAKIVDLVLAGCKRPLVLDADALNLLAQQKNAAARLAALSIPLVLTPHLGEMSRLFGTSIAALKKDPIGTASHFSLASGAVTVLKDARTVIASGTRVYLNTYGNSGMATGGSGDVLSGVIASLLAQGARGDKAAYLGVLAHALAGDAAAARLGNRAVMASDIIDGLCEIKA